MFRNSQSKDSDEGRAPGSLVIFARVEGLLRESTHAASDAACDPLRFLATRDVPLVLVSAWGATDLLQLQNECSFNQPFICLDGAALHVPRTWLNASALATPPVDDDQEWEIFRFSHPSVSAAFELVSAIFLARGYDPLLTVGIGCDLADYALLTAVDIPIVVRNQSPRQSALLHQLPGVYITTAAGTAGWSEAVWGVSP